jgi:hypothetical protein
VESVEGSVQEARGAGKQPRTGAILLFLRVFEAIKRTMSTLNGERGRHS